MHNRVGLGSFPLAGVFNKISSDDAESLVKRFVDKGGYYIDTAPLYGYGEVEKLLGRALKSIDRDKFYLITKTVKYIDDKGKVFESGKGEDVIKQIDHSLSRLNLDYLDLLMVHSPDPNTPIDETLSAMEELQKAGKVRDLAISNVNLEELKEYNKTKKIKYVQNRFSLINRSLSPDFENYFLDNNIHLIPYHLLEIGMLTGIAFENFKPRKGDLREQLPYWNEENQRAVFAWVRDSLAPIAKKLGITIGQLNMAWALHQPFIDFIVIGTTKPEYLEINMNANDIKLSKEVLQEIENKYKELEKSVHDRYGKTMRDFRGLNEKYY